MFDRFQSYETWKEAGRDRRAALIESHLARQKIVTACVSNEVQSILDIGCGNGEVTNVLPERLQVVALDLSLTALRCVQRPKVRASCTALPFQNRQFDLCLCLEVLEHLSGDEADKTVSEIKRVARTWIIVGVPDREIREMYMITCPNCYRNFHAWGHRRSYSEKDLDKCFSCEDWHKVAIVRTGEIVNYPPRWQIKVFRASGGTYFTPKDFTVCPACGNTEFEQDTSQLPFIARSCYRAFEILRAVKLGVPQPRPYWAIACYRRKDLSQEQILKTNLEVPTK
jgi:SAM-dependent methyltransferase